SRRSTWWERSKTRLRRRRRWPDGRAHEGPRAVRQRRACPRAARAAQDVGCAGGAAGIGDADAIDHAGGADEDDAGAGSSVVRAARAPLRRWPRRAEKARIEEEPWRMS